MGVGLYIFNRKHLKTAPLYSKVMFSVFGSAMFNFGSVLFWATTKNILPKCDHVRLVFGVMSGISFLAIGYEYLKYVDSKVVSEVD